MIFKDVSDKRLDLARNCKHILTIAIKQPESPLSITDQGSPRIPDTRVQWLTSRYRMTAS
jgi:hypothetical protein